MSKKLCAALGLKDIAWSMIGGRELVPAGTVLKEPELLFEKIDDQAIAAQKQKLEEARRKNVLDAFTPEPQAPEVDIDTFGRCDLRVGTIVECKKVPKAKKLLQFLIDDGTDKKRTIVSGIAEYYKPEDLVGKQVCFIANLPPRNLRGIVSEGMILSAVNADGSLVTITPSSPVVPGAKIG